MIAWSAICPFPIAPEGSTRRPSRGMCAMRPIAGLRNVSPAASVYTKDTPHNGSRASTLLRAALGRAPRMRKADGASPGGFLLCGRGGAAAAARLIKERDGPRRLLLPVKKRFLCLVRCLAGRGVLD